MLAIRPCWGVMIGLLLVVCSREAGAQDNDSLKPTATATITLRGIVKDSLSGQPLQGAEIKLLRDTIRFPPASVVPARTDETGVFLMSDVPLGSYILHVRRLGYERRQLPIQVSGQTPRTVTIRMAPVVRRLCELHVVPAIIVDITDSVTGALLAEQASGEVRDGDYVDSLQPKRWTKDWIMASRAAAEERPGTYEVTVMHHGYAPWSIKGVKVNRDECHVETVELKARLRRLP